MKLGQILDILEKRYSDEVLEELYSDEWHKRVRDREKTIRTIWKNVIVPQVSKIQHMTKHMTKAQKIGLYHYLDFHNRSDDSKILADKIGVENDALIKQFRSLKNNYLPRDSYKKYIGHIAIGNLEIFKLYRIKDNPTKLEKSLQGLYEKSLEELMSRLREAIVDSETMTELKNIEGIAPYLTEDNEKGIPTDSLKITELKVTDLHVMRMGSEGTNNWMFVKIETDAGICGWGEASLQYKDDALLGEFAAFKRFLLGKNPFEIERIWTSLYRRVTWSGGPVTMSAISAIDLALWDIKGKALGVPVYELLGGKSHDKIRMYANGWPRKDNTPEGMPRA